MSVVVYYCGLRFANIRLARHFLLKHETADPQFYAWLHPGYSLADRVDHLRMLLEFGYEVGSGFVVGLPGQAA